MGDDVARQHGCRSDPEYCSDAALPACARRSECDSRTPRLAIASPGRKHWASRKDRANRKGWANCQSDARGTEASNVDTYGCLLHHRGTFDRGRDICGGATNAGTGRAAGSARTVTMPLASGQVSCGLSWTIAGRAPRTEGRRLSFFARRNGDFSCPSGKCLTKRMALPYNKCLSRRANPLRGALRRAKDAEANVGQNQYYSVTSWYGSHTGCKWCNISRTGAACRKGFPDRKLQ